MALVLANRVQETATPNTTVSFTLAGAVAGFQTFAVIGNTNTTYYSATDSSGNWEVGEGTYSTSGPTLARTTVYASSNSGSAVTFPGSVNVFVTYPSGKSVNLDASGNVSALGTVSSGTWQGSTVGVAYGGTGVTVSSGPNSLVLRDANENITVNRLSQGLQTITASGGTTTLTAASDFNQQLVGTGGHTFRLPDATTLTDTTTFQFNNNATGTLTIQNNAATTVGTVSPGGATGIALMDNSTSGGTWDVHGYLPENITWGTNSLYLASDIVTGGTWQGGTIQSGYGGTGLTTFAGANNALYSTSASALAAGTLPVAAGGTGNTSGQAATVANAATFNSSGSGAASGSTYNGGSTITVSYNTIGAPSTTGTNASGTWGINVTGNAATATSATTAATANALNTGNNYQVNSIGVGAAPSGTAGRINATTAVITPGTSGVSTGFTVVNGDITSYRSGGTTGVIYLSSSGGNYLYWDGANYYLGGNIALSSANYNSYAPTLTGTGATGTWGINITGNAATATTAANVNNGTLSMGVSGTGLSGSASFTANLSGNSSFTVTSNATNVNTASTIVARDASGNFSAGTITATLSGSATSAGSVTNSVTFNNGGAGSASGITFNGSTARTISYNTIGAPSTGGTNATGTWGISITGNAGTATTATNVSGGTVSSTRVNPRSLASPFGSGSLTINGNTTDVYTVSLSGAITFLTPSGTPVNGQRLVIRVKDSGAALGITWTTSSGAFRGVGVTLPTTTVAGKVTYIGCIYNSADVFWDAVAVTTQA